MTDERIRLREEVQMQIRALKEMASMAAKYGCDITVPAENAKEAVQHLYMAYLAGIKKITVLQQVLDVHPHSLISTSRETLKEA